VREHPDALKKLHIDFERADPDIVEAFTLTAIAENACVLR
jgi:hypothetical protein